MTDFVRGLDIRTPQISIQAKIIFVDRTDIEELGIKYDLGNRNQFFNKLVQRPNPTETGHDLRARTQHHRPGRQLGSPPSVTPTPPSAVGARPGLLHRHRRLHPHHVPERAGAGSSRTSRPSRSSPRWTTARPTSSWVRRPRSGSSTPPPAAPAPPARHVQFKETGIRLTVTPHVTNNRQISDGAAYRAVRRFSAGRGRPGLHLPKQKADNQLLVNDGETAVIGGLTVTEVEKNRRGIPLLSGLPIVQTLQLQRRPGEPA